MSKFGKIFGMVATTVLLAGCNSVSSMGEVNGVQYHAVRSTDLVGPSAVVIVSVDENGNQTVASFGSDGILPAGIAAAGNVAAAEVRDADRVESTTNVKVHGHRGPLSQP